MKRKKRGGAEINSGSMADIAFLLLIFFLVTTTIASDKGLTIRLPPKPPDDQPPEVELNERNIFKVLVNSKDNLLVEGEPLDDVSQIKEKVKEFVLNFGKATDESAQVYNALPGTLKVLSKKDPKSSDTPGDAVVSFKTDRGTSYERYIEVLDEIQGAYYEIYAERVDVPTDDFRDLKPADPRYKRGREGIPMQISIAEPTKIGG